MNVYNRLPESFESGQNICYVVADPDGVIVSFDVRIGRYLIVLQGPDMPGKAEDAIHDVLGDSYDTDANSLVMMLQRMVEDMVDASDTVAGFEIYTKDPAAPALLFDKYRLPRKP